MEERRCGCGLTFVSTTRPCLAGIRNFEEGRPSFTRVSSVTMSNYSGLTMTMSPAFNGRKRRQPMDPPEDNDIDFGSKFLYDSERNNIHDHVDKRHRGETLDNNLLGVDDDDDDATNAALLSFGSSSLSLNPPDPPANYGFPYPSISTTASLSNDNNIIRSGDYAAIPKTTHRLPIDPVESIRSPGGLLLMNNTHGNSNNNDDVSMASDDDGNRLHDDEERIEGDIIDNDDDDECNNSVCSAISESSIKSAMYQLVFGRWRPPSPLTHVGGTNSGGTNGTSGGGTVVGRYDAVDSKIEDMIRRSRLEAVIRSSKSEDGNSRDQSPMSSRLSDVDMDDDAIDN